MSTVLPRVGTKWKFRIPIAFDALDTKSVSPPIYVLQSSKVLVHRINVLQVLSLIK